MIYKLHMLRAQHVAMHLTQLYNRLQLHSRSLLAILISFQRLKCLEFVEENDQGHNQMTLITLHKIKNYGPITAKYAFATFFF